MIVRDSTKKKGNLKNEGFVHPPDLVMLFLDVRDMNLASPMPRRFLYKKVNTQLFGFVLVKSEYKRLDQWISTVIMDRENATPIVNKGYIRMKQPPQLLSNLTNYPGG